MSTISKLSLFKRYNGVYYIIYEQDGTTKWKSTKKKLKQEAHKVLSEFETYLKQDKPKITFLQLKQQVLSFQSNNLRPTTISRIYHPAFKSFEAICGNKYISAYTLRDVEYYKEVRLKTCSPTTVNIAFRTLKGVFNLAIKWQLLIENPFCKSKQIRTPFIIPAYLLKEEFKQLYDIIEEGVIKDMVLFAAFTGLRLGEIINLTWENIDFEKRQILINSTDRFTTKTGRIRTVPMSDMIFDTLKKRELTKAFCEFVFHKKGKQITGFYASHKFKFYIRKLNINENIHFHSLRHTFATWLVKEGVSIYEVQKLLGHSSVKVTEVYSHLATSELHQTVNRISLT